MSNFKFSDFDHNPVSLLSSSRCNITNQILQITFIDKFSNGQVILELKAEASQSDFKDAILAVLRSPPSLTPLHAGSLNASYPQLQGNTSSSNYRTDLSSSATNAEPDVSLQPTTTSTIQDLSRYRQQRLEVEKNKRADADRAQQKAKAKARHEATENVSGSSKAKQASYVQQRRKRQQEEKLEQERIRRDIEYDKAARKEKEVCRRAFYETESKDIDNLEGLAGQNLPSNAHRISQRSPNRCALQVRLFDGSTIRKEFQPHQTMRTDVRAWVDEQSNHRDEPYTFKQILTPMPNRTIGISEEEESLISLHLMPSATLVKVPISNFTEAYDQGIVSRGVSASYNIASLGVNMITGALHKVLGFGQAIRAAEESTLQSQSQQPAMGRTNTRIRSLQDRKEESQEHQLYNGNQVCLLQQHNNSHRKLMCVAKF